jgi:hypothetical protein
VAYQLEFQMKPNYLHACVRGQNTPENTRAYLGDILRECQARACQRVLIEEKMEGPLLQGLEIYQIASELSLKAQGILRVAAFVDEGGEGEMLQFAENVAVNRGLFGKVFRSLAEAEEWISQDR